MLNNIFDFVIHICGVYQIFFHFSFFIFYFSFFIAFLNSLGQEEYIAQNLKKHSEVHFLLKVWLFSIFSQNVDKMMCNDTVTVTSDVTYFFKVKLHFQLSQEP